MGKRHLLVVAVWVACTPAQSQGEAQLSYAEPAESPARSESAAQDDASPPAANAEREPAAEPRGPKYVSFTLRNACRQTVKLFFGETPKFGSGRTDTMSGNSLRSERLKEGQTIWLLDASGNGQSSFTVSSSTKQLVIGTSCTGFQTTYP